MNRNEIVAALSERLGLEEIVTWVVPADDLFVSLPAASLLAAVEVLQAFSVAHLSTITGQDTGEAIQLLYHFWDRGGLTLCIDLPRQDPRVETLTQAIPGASFYEREVAEMLGVTFEGSTDQGPMFLPDDWEGGAPLRKEGGDG
jgi:NADH:ubiquinone oxidoreductase subunit C